MSLSYYLFLSLQSLKDKACLSLEANTASAMQWGNSANVQWVSKRIPWGDFHAARCWWSRWPAGLLLCQPFRTLLRCISACTFLHFLFPCMSFCNISVPQGLICIPSGSNCSERKCLSWWIQNLLKILCLVGSYFSVTREVLVWGNSQWGASLVPPGAIQLDALV